MLCLCVCVFVCVCVCVCVCVYVLMEVFFVSFQCVNYTCRCFILGGIHLQLTCKTGFQLTYRVFIYQCYYLICT